VPSEQITDYWVEVARECWFLSKWEYLGEVRHEEKVDLLSRAKALLFPVQWAEPFGLTVIEALACGTPTIAYRHAAMPEIIKDGETGFLVKDEKTFMNAMRKIDNIDPEDCRKDAEKRWSSERMAKDYVELFDEVLRGGKW
jgi:glycosyltransferase involved in cell wall biosynthesis